MSYPKQLYYLALKNFCLGVDAFCTSQSIDPSLLSGTGENSRESIYLNGLAQAENAALQLQQTRWEIENELFETPLTTRHDKSRIMIFTDVIDFAGLSKSDTQNNLLNILINPNILLASTREKYSYQPKSVNYKYIQSLGEVIAHEEGHYKHTVFENSRRQYGFL